MPQFGLRTLMLVVLAFAVLFAVMSAIGPRASAALAFALILVGVHVVGNWLGTRLRDEDSQCSESPTLDALDRPTDPNGLVALARAVASAPPTRLQDRTPPGWLMLAACIVGSIGGGTCGGLALLLLARVSIGGAVVGTISSAVVGAFLGFLAGSFAEIAHRAWRQATSEPPRPTLASRS